MRGAARTRGKKADCEAPRGRVGARAEMSRRKSPRRERRLPKQSGAPRRGAARTRGKKADCEAPRGRVFAEKDFGGGGKVNGGRKGRI
ncbi:unnamed protein product [Linum trigynum]|uniref:Uncharacterized protein n=1 Tax=Linum trigynum TaxID=586398 RepID=A0AAV2FHG2_9ROSI